MRKTRQSNDHAIIVISMTKGHPSRFLGRCDKLAIFEVVREYLNGELISTAGGCLHGD